MRYPVQNLEVDIESRMRYVQFTTYANAVTYITSYESSNILANRKTFLVEIVADESTSPSGDHALYRYVPTDSTLPRLRTILEG